MLDDVGDLEGVRTVCNQRVHDVVWHLIVRMRPFLLVMARNLSLFDAIFRAGHLLALSENYVIQRNLG